MRAPGHRGLVRAAFALWTAALLGGGLSGCATRTDSAGLDGPGEGLAVRRGTLERRLVLTGVLAAVREQAVLVPREAAWRHPIRKLVEHGARVEEGDVVVEFDNSQAVQRLQEAELRVVSALNDLVAKEATGAGELATKRIELARRRADRDKAALDAAIPEEMRSEREWQEAQLALREAESALKKAEDDLTATEAGLRADVEVARLQLAKAERDADSAERAIDELSLKAPGSGIALVGDHPWEGRPLQLGDTVFAGHPVVSIPDLTEMKVEAWLSDVDDGLVQPGMAVAAVLDAHPERRFAGVVSSVAPVATTEAQSRSLRRSFLVTVELEDSDPELMIPGMSVRLEVEVETLDDVLLVPRSALEQGPEGWLVRLEDGSAAPVELGPCDAFDCLLVEGPAEDRRLARLGTDS